MRAVLSLAPVPLLVVCAVGLCGCETEARDRDPPRLLTVEPSLAVVPVTTSWRVTFSEPLNAATVDGDPTSDALSVVLAPRSIVTDTFLSDFDNPGISETRQAQVVPLDVDLDGAELTVQPRAALEPRTAYVLLISSEVRDTRGNPLVDTSGNKALMRWDVSTDDGAPAIASTDLVSGAATLVVPNRRRITVRFNQPVQGVDRQSLFLVGQGGAKAPVIEAVLMSEARDEASILLAPLDDATLGCERLAPAATYTLQATAAIVADTGQALTPYAEDFDTGAACDVTPLVVTEAPVSIPGEVAATVRFETNKASTTEVRFGTSPPLDCGGAGCPIVGARASQPITGTSPPRFLHSVELTGLSVGVTYQYLVSAEDDVGLVATAGGSFVTAPLPKVSINEVMANPPAGFTSESTGEYVELANFGDTAVDVSSWALQVDGGDDGGGKTCPIVDPAGARVIEPGAFLLLVGSGFDGTLYGGVDDSGVVRGSASTFCGQLTNSRAQSFVLVDPDGRPVSSVSAYASIVPDEDGRSVERSAPEAADVEESFCYSPIDRGPSPLSQNGVVAAGCG